jgi:hypothetical protein
MIYMHLDRYLGCGFQDRNLRLRVSGPQPLILQVVEEQGIHATDVEVCRESAKSLITFHD